MLQLRSKNLRYITIDVDTIDIITDEYWQEKSHYEEEISTPHKYLREYLNQPRALELQWEIYHNETKIGLAKLHAINPFDKTTRYFATIPQLYSTEVREHIEAYANKHSLNIINNTEF